MKRLTRTRSAIRRNQVATDDAGFTRLLNPGPEFVPENSPGCRSYRGSGLLYPRGEAAGALTRTFKHR